VYIESSSVNGIANTCFEGEERERERERERNIYSEKFSFELNGKSK